MITRTTTVGTMKTYRYNMKKSAYYMNKSMNQVQTRRYFNSFAEDPAGAAKSFQLRSAFLRTSSQYDLNESVIHKYDVAYGALDSVDKALDTEGGNSAFFEQLRSLNDADASARNALGQSCKALARSVVQDMNGRYGDNFVFSGADGLRVPFTWDAKVNPDYDPEFDPTDKTLEENCRFLKSVEDPPGSGTFVETFTDDPADPDLVKIPEENPNYDSYYEVDPDDPEYDESKALKYIKRDANGEISGYTDDTNDPDIGMVPKANPNYQEDNIKQYPYLKESGKGAISKTDAAQVLYYRGVRVDTADTTKLDYFSNSEKKYVDLGLGYDMMDGKVESSTVFNQSLQGVDYLGGYGTDKDGDPKNVVSIMNRMGEILQNCDPNNGSWANDAEKEEFYRLCDKFEAASARVKEKFTELSTQATFLDNNQEQLTTTAKSLNEQIEALDYANNAESISEFIWAKYCYDTSLKVGNSVLGQSLMDYLDL